MGKFSKEIPLNPDSSLGPVTIGSKIVVERGKEPLPLQGGNVVLVPGCGWDPGTVTISPEMDKGGTKLNILVRLANEISLSHYTGVILTKKPIQLEVTLFPKMMVPGMGVPVTVSAAPITDEVNVTIPAIKQPEIGLDAKFTGKTSDGKYNLLLTATLELPPYISQAEKDSVIRNLTIDVTDKKNATVEKGAMTQDGAGKTLELTASPDFKSKDGTAMITVASEVNLAGLPLSKTKQVSFEIGRNYILNIHPAALDVTMKKPGSFTAKVLEEMPDGQNVLVTDARLSTECGSDVVSVKPDKGEGTITCTVSQNKISDAKTISLLVHASAGVDSVKPQAVPVYPETISYGSLEVVFPTPEKNHLNPYIKTDYVVIRATLMPTTGNPPVKADIEFECESSGGWLDGPTDYTLSVDPNSPISGPADTTVTLPLSGSGSDTHAADGDYSRTVKFTGRIADPEMKKKPPASENIIVRAIVEGTVVDEKSIPITLDLKQTLTASPMEVTFLATAKQERPGRPEAPISAPIKLSVTDPGDGQWKFSVEYKEIELVPYIEQDKSLSSEVFLFEIAENIPRFEQKPGVAPGQQDIKVKTFATLGDLKIEGPVITISILYEGIYPKSLFEYDKEGKLLPVTEKGRVTINVLDPAEKRAPLETVDDVVGRHMFPYMTFENWEWDGTKLACINSTDIFADPDPQRFKENSPAGDQWYFIFSLKDAEMVVAYSGDRDGALSDSTWHITFQKQIPGKGEEVKGFVRFFRKEYYDEAKADNSNWYYDLPVTLKLGNADELKEQMSFVIEGGRCEKIIEKCFPKEYRAKLRESLDNLEHKGANDYRVFSWEIHKTAYEIWEEDNKDFLIWDNRWSNLIYGAEIPVYAGDLAFNAVVMFYTAPLGPVASFGLATIVTEIKAESLAVYDLYVRKGKGADFINCISEYTEDHWVQFITDMAIKTPVELFILRKFELKELLKQPKVYGSMLAWLWLWKFSVHLKEDGENDGGFINSAKKATEELCGVLLTFVLADFVKAHGRTNLKDLYKGVCDRGFFGGTEVPQGENETEGKVEDDASITKPRPGDPDYFNNLRKGMTRDAEGNWRASDKDVLDLMRHPEELRHLNKEGDPVLKEAFDRSRREIYAKHDEALKEWIKNSPEYKDWLKDHPECEGMPIEIVDFSTPGNAKPGEKLNTDRDYRAGVLIGYDSANHPIYKEIPNSTNQWEKKSVPWDEKSYEIFGELTGRQNQEKPISAKDWATEHQQLGTYELDPEACMDFKDQGHLKWNEETQQYESVLQPSMESNIANVKKGRGRLLDPEGVGTMYKTKVGDAVDHYGEPEGYAQARKACEMLKEVQHGYSADPSDGGMGYDIGTPPKNFTQAMDEVIKAGGKPWDKAVIQQANENLQKLGYKDINDFTDALSNQFGALRIARKSVK